MRGQCWALPFNLNSSSCVWRPYNLVLPQRAAEALKPARSHRQPPEFRATHCICLCALTMIQIFAAKLYPHYMQQCNLAACLSSMVIMAAGCLRSVLQNLPSAQLAALRGSRLLVVCICSLNVSSSAPGIVALFDWRGDNPLLPAAGKKARSSIARHLAFIFARCVAIDLADWKLEILLDYAVETPAHPNGEHPSCP